MGQTIPDSEGKSKGFLRRVLESRDLFPALLLITVGLASFGLGRLSVGDSQALPWQRFSSGIERMGNDAPADVPARAAAMEAEASAPGADALAAPSGKKYVGSRNSNKYHAPFCPGAARIAEENKVWFASKEEAAAAGYTPAGNCKGI